MLGSAGSYLDGGANGPLQELSLPLMELDFIRKDAIALQRHFRKKRDYLLSELRKLGIVVAFEPSSTFYVWACLSELPPPLNDVSYQSLQAIFDTIYLTYMLQSASYS